MEPQVFSIGGLTVERFVLGPFGVNTYLVRDTKTGEALVVDPGQGDPTLLNHLETIGGNPLRVFLTHGHADHILGLPDLKARFPVRTFCSAEDAPMLTDPELNLSASFGFPLHVGAPDSLLGNGGTFRLGDHPGSVIALPGHTPGGLAFCFEELVFTGDALFAGSIGRSDFPGGDGSLLVRMIRERLLPIQDRIVFPGHGPETRLSIESRENPFLA